MQISELLEWSRWGLFNKNKHYNYKIFLAREIPRIPKIDLLTNLTSHPVIPNFNLNSIINFTKNRKESDYVLVPHNWVHIKKNAKYLSYLTSLSHETPILVVNSGDISPKLDLANSLELRTFLHPWENLNRKIIIPNGVKERNFTERKWKPIPTISFVGYVPKLGFGSLFGKNLYGILDPIKSSVYLHRKLSTSKLQNLESIFKVEIIIRSEFTAYKSNPNLKLHSGEFQESLNRSDYVLCPRGSGNNSVRFYEVLSSGATPILIDSGSELPVIRDDRFWFSNIIKLGLFDKWKNQILADWLYLEQNDNYVNRQTQNREVFMKELNIKNYLSNLFEKYLK